jgi:hypothetical protein
LAAAIFEPRVLGMDQRFPAKPGAFFRRSDDFVFSAGENAVEK